jgi:preprotein translocase subunit SecA
MSFLAKTLQALFGTKSDKDIKLLQPYVQKTNEEYLKLHKLSNDELRHKTQEFKQKINQHLAEFDAKIESLKSQAIETKDLEKKDSFFEEAEKIVKEKDKALEVILLEILPQAFAVVKETARRFTENTELTAKATDLDIDLASKHAHITINNDLVTYQNSWIAAGNTITWNMVHYDVQIIGGTALHQGKIAEMTTGEGKTLVSTLPAYLNALAGLGVHLVTVNDYLARRDCEWNSGLFNFLGLTVDCIDKTQPNSEERRKAYRADITYGTNNEFGFDYLRDNMARSPEDMVQRKHHFAIVDEVDSVLVDDARTPLIISGPTPGGENQEYETLKPRIVSVVEAQKKIVNTFLNEAKTLIAQGKNGEKEGEGGLALLRAYRGLPKHKALIKYLSEPGIKTILQKTENYYMQDQNKEMPKCDIALYFVIEEKLNSVDFTDKGYDLITKNGEDHNLFILPDLGSEIAELEKRNIDTQEKATLKTKLLEDFAKKSDTVHSLHQLLRAYTMFDKDIEYVVMDNKVKIVDEQTGRILDGRRYSDGLHQAIEAKESVQIEAATQTWATITLQNYFRMFHKLAGMTGTAETEATELWDIYKLDVVVIPTNKTITRKDRDDLVYKTAREKFNAVIDEINDLREKGRPVLVGTTSVEISELLSRMLRLRNIPHQVLNAKQHQKEAEVVANAGLAGTITIATNMAGRGTDIKLGEGVKEAGGLAIIGTERHDSRRVDRQLRGRAGRQGDPGTSQFYVSLEDQLMRHFGSERIAGLMDKMGHKEGEVIQHSMITSSIERAQKKVEENNFGIRKRLLEYDDIMNKQREVIYKRRRNALFGERLAVDLNNMMYDMCSQLVEDFKDGNDYLGYELECVRVFGISPAINEEEFKNTAHNSLISKMFNQVNEHYTNRLQSFCDSIYPFVQNVYTNHKNEYVNIAIPFTDGSHIMQIVSNLENSYTTQSKSVFNDFEKQ